jgi:hypothetical protein
MVRAHESKEDIDCSACKAHQGELAGLPPKASSPPLHTLPSYIQAGSVGCKSTQFAPKALHVTNG